MTAALKFDPAQNHRPLGEHRPEEIDEAARKVLRSKPRITAATIRKAATVEGSIAHGAAAVVRATKHKCLVGFTEADILRVGDRIVRALAREEHAERAKDTTGPTAARIRRRVEEHALTLEEDVKDREKETAEARKANRAAAARVAEYPVQAHKQALRESIEAISVCEAREAGARSKAAEFRRSLVKNKRKFGELIEKGVAGSSTDFPRKMSQTLSRIETLFEELGNLGHDLVNGLEETQRAAAEARQLAAELCVPENLLTAHRTIEASDLRSYVAKAAARGVKATGISELYKFQDLYDLKRGWS